MPNPTGGMQVLATIAEFRSARRRLEGDLGLVPTMGALHEGHLSLIRLALAHNRHVAVSIFVNPMQFGPGEDLESYPRNPARDLDLLKETGVAMVFQPNPGEMFPPDFATFMEPGDPASRLEGAARPGHFRGIATVVCKLLNVVRPERAYFGQKDAQQLAVIRRLVRDLNLDVAIVAAPTAREKDGLALSSRNTYLTPEERAAAPVLYRGLSAAAAAFAAGERSAGRLREIVAEEVAAEAAAELEYVSVANPDDMRELDQASAGAVLSLAARLGRARLIDNVVLKET